MTKRVDQGLSSNSVNLMLHLWWQRSLAADNYNSKVNIRLYLKPNPNVRQSKNQIRCVKASRAEALNCVPALLDSLPHDL
jgi:hypothetical protein